MKNRLTLDEWLDKYVSPEDRLETANLIKSFLQLFPSAVERNTWDELLILAKKYL